MKNTELPDAIRVPLDELEADARYLAARLANGTMAPSIGAAAIQRRTRAIRDALLAHGVKAKAVDRGPWSVVLVDGKPELFSDDFEHDVKLRISGDFADDQQRMNYANALAAQLNAARGVTASDGSKQS